MFAVIGYRDGVPGEASLMGVANLIGPGLFTLTFAFAVGTARDWGVPGAAFLVAAALLGCAIMVALRVTGSAGVPPALLK